MNFLLEAQAEFVAEDIEDALKKLEDHFRKIREDEGYLYNGDSPFWTGEIHIRPLP